MTTKVKVAIFGNGDAKVIERIEKHTHAYYTQRVTFADGTKRSYTKKGKHHYGTVNHDIVKIV